MRLFRAHLRRRERREGVALQPVAALPRVPARRARLRVHAVGQCRPTTSSAGRSPATCSRRATRRASRSCSARRAGSDYGHGSGNPRCRDCMVHSGFEASAVQEGSRLAGAASLTMARAALAGPRLSARARRGAAAPAAGASDHARSLETDGPSQGWECPAIARGAPRRLRLPRRRDADARRRRAGARATSPTSGTRCCASGSGGARARRRSPSRASATWRSPAATRPRAVASRRGSGSRPSARRLAPRR